MTSQAVLGKYYNILSLFRSSFQKGQRCPVPGCGPETYSNFVKMTWHWKAKHERILTLQLCMFCNKTFSRRSDALKHVRPKHSMGFRPFTITNRSFIDPGTSRMSSFPYSEPMITDSENDTPNVMAETFMGINPYSVGDGGTISSRQTLRSITNEPPRKRSATSTRQCLEPATTSASQPGGGSAPKKPTPRQLFETRAERRAHAAWEHHQLAEKAARGPLAALENRHRQIQSRDDATIMDVV